MPPPSPGPGPVPLPCARRTRPSPESAARLAVPRPTRAAPVATQEPFRHSTSSMFDFQNIVLASASPRRAELLRAADIPVEIHPAHIDEDVQEGELPDAYVLRIAEAKARAIAWR